MQTIPFHFLKDVQERFEELNLGAVAKCDLKTLINTDFQDINGSSGKLSLRMNHKNVCAFGNPTYGGDR